MIRDRRRRRSCVGIEVGVSSGIGVWKSIGFRHLVVKDLVEGL